MKAKKKYKILVLSDLEKNTENLLKSTVSLTKLIDADLQLFYVKKPTDVVKNDNQLSAKRSINKEYFTIDTKTKKLVDSFYRDYKIAIDYSFAIGNLKDEIGGYLNKNKPDIVVIGKNSAKSFNVFKDNLTSFVLEKYNGSVIIASDNNLLESDNDLSLGFFNSKKEDFTTNSLLQDIIQNSQVPLKYFRVAKKSEGTKEEKQEVKETALEYVFEENSTVFKSISMYISKNKVNLLCLNKQNKKINNKNLLRELSSNTNIFINNNINYK